MFKGLFWLIGVLVYAQNDGAYIDKLVLKQALKPLWQKASVVYVYDGDTVKIKINAKYYKARLYNIETIETRQGRKLSAQAKKCKTSTNAMLKFAQQSKTYTMEALLNQDIKIALMGQDDYGRLLVWIKDFNYSIVKDGFASVYYTYGKKSIDEFTQVMHTSRKLGRGLWSTLQIKGHIPKKCYR